MTIARIEIDFIVRDDEKFEDILDLVGEMVNTVLDPHLPDGSCTRWLDINGYADVEDEYELGLEDDEVDARLFCDPDLN